MVFNITDALKHFSCVCVCVYVCVISSSHQSLHVCFMQASCSSATDVIEFIFYWWVIFNIIDDVLHYSKHKYKHTNKHIIGDRTTKHQRQNFQPPQLKPRASPHVGQTSHPIPFPSLSLFLLSFLPRKTLHIYSHHTNYIEKKKREKNNKREREREFN